MDSRCVVEKRTKKSQHMAGESSSKPKKPRQSLIHLTPHMSPQPDNDEEVPLEIHSLEESVGHPRELVNYAKIETSVIVNQREHMCYE
jgi:hypothetical protein